MAGTLISIISFVVVTAFVGFNIIIAYDRKDSLGEIEMAGLSYLFGIGAISIEMFILGLSGLKFTTPYILAPWVLLSIINIPRFRRRVVAMREASKQSEKRDCLFGKRPDSILLAMTAALLVFVIAYAFFMAMIRPIESYDAVAIWALKAKILYYVHTMSPDFFNMLATKFHGAQIDYPLLLPLSEVWFYTFINSFNDYLVKILFPMNFLAFLAVFYVFLKKAASSRLFALIFTFFLASVKHFIDYATNGYADMQMAIYASVTFLALYTWIRSKNPAYFWTALFSCIFAIWTKNEGAMVMIGFLAALAIYVFTLLKRGDRNIIPYKKIFTASCVLLVLFIAWFMLKRSLAVENVIFDDKTFANHGFADIFRRAGLIAYEYQRQVFGVKYWNLAWIAFMGLICVNFKKIFYGYDRYIVIPIFIILSGYTAIYFITPLGLEWHLRFSANRLLLHILPLAIFYIALVAKRACYDMPEDGEFKKYGS